VAIRLVCDKCGAQLDKPEAIALALEGTAAWQASARARGAEPRGVFPCRNYVRCGGEMVVYEDKNGHKGGKTDKQ
jgi:hypothetical protein